MTSIIKNTIFFQFNIILSFWKIICYTQNSFLSFIENTGRKKGSLTMSNLSKLKREKLIEKLNNIRENYNDDNEMRKILNMIEVELTSKKYGLIWEHHEERVDIEMKTKIPVFTEDKSREIRLIDGDYNFLLEGDNLHALKLLEKTHKRRIDVIYIDPPYNIGGESGFIYDDSYIDDNDNFSHSKWLSFMATRLTIAKKLLSKQGVIFISINDKEFAQLKLLCDEIFGAENFYGNLLWKSRTKSTNSGKARRQIQQAMEYILVYGRQSKAIFDGFELLYKEDGKSYPHNGIHGKCRFENLEATDHGRKKRDTMKFPILGIRPREGRRWQIGEETAKQLVAEGKIELVDGIPKRAYYPGDEEESFIPFWSLITDYGTAETGKAHLSNIIGANHGFDTVKPLDLMELIFSRTKKDAVILDFFAGSGTSGEAVLACNKKDGGNRKFILCTDNSVGKQIQKQLVDAGVEKNSSQWEEHGICQSITYPRLKAVIEGYTSQKNTKHELFSVNLTPSSMSNYSNWMKSIDEIKALNEFDSYEVKVENNSLVLYGKTKKGETVPGLSANLKYYKTNYVEKNNTETLVNDKLLNHIAELIQLENHTSIDNLKNVLLVTDEDAELFLQNIPQECKRIYKEANIMFESKVELLLKKANIEIYDIPEYYFSRELREVGEL